MKGLLMEIANTYLDVTKKQYNRSYAEAKYISEDMPQKITTILSKQQFDYKVEGSVGQGGWTFTPWISIFNKEVTVSATKGYYVVYLFSKDMERVYLSLNLGTTYIKNKYSGKKPRQKMMKLANNIAETIKYDPRFNRSPIDLGSSTDNALNYEASHIIGKKYDLANLPDDEILKEDLLEMLKVYENLFLINRNKAVDDVIDYYLQLEEVEDVQFQQDIEVVEPSITPRIPQEKRGKKNKSGKVYSRDASVAKEAIVKAEYKCEVDPTHETFISEITGQNFVEAHHLVPISKESEFDYSLDVPGNIVSLCPNCHRKIHHSKFNEKKKVLNSLYILKESELKTYGIHLPLSQMEQFYK
ncbi:MrcB family domain-containing protein [Lysinibacillus fusiformis]|uniref:MrcB family domain-containing protein n=1 Tax=Lysinibacillus fusiformis TaxID=28031 RepID=UPI003D0821BC